MNQLYVDYWVSAKDGKKGNPGTREKPFRNIKEALAVVKDGQTIGIFPKGAKPFQSVKGG